MDAEEARQILHMIDESWWRMSRPAENRKWRPPADELNPGSFKPQGQSLGGRPAIDHSVTVTTRPGGVVDSNGQTQLPNLRPLDSGVKVQSSGGKFAAKTFDGGQAMLPNLRPIDGVTTSDVTPRAQTVDVSAQNLHIVSSGWAKSSRPPTSINPDAVRHGGVPTNHNVR